MAQDDGRKVIALTGAAGILGSVMTRRLVDDGHIVVALDRDAVRLDALADEFGERVRTYVVDVTSPGDLRTLSTRIAAEVGDVDVLVNAAAGKSEHFFHPFEEFPLDDWNEVMGLNLTSAMLCAQVFGAPMARRGRGAIVNILSIYGVVAPDQRIYEGSEYLGRPINTPAVYSASKAGLWGLTRYLASYWGAAGVRVNAVTPGGVFSGQNDTFVERYSARVPMDRMAEPHEIADAVAFLASDRSSYVNGHNLVVDGGLSVW